MVFAFAPAGIIRRAKPKAQFNDRNFTVSLIASSQGLSSPSVLELALELELALASVVVSLV